MIQAVNSGDLLVRQLEIKDVEVLDDARRGHRLRENNVTDLQVPANDDLSGLLSSRLGNIGEDGIVEVLRLAQRAPGCLLYTSDAADDCCRV